MNIETGQIFPARTTDEQKSIKEMLDQGEPIVPVSERVARTQLIGQSVVRRQKRRFKSRSKYNSRTGNRLDG